VLWATLAVALVAQAPGAQGHRFHVSRSQWRVIPAVGVLGATFSMTGSDFLLFAPGVAKPVKDTPGSPMQLVEEALEAALSLAIQVVNDGRPCVMKVLRSKAQKKLRVGLRWTCAGALGHLKVDFAFLPRMAAGHRHMVRLNVAGEVEDRVFTRAHWRYRRRFQPAPKPPVPTRAPPPPPASNLWLIVSLLATIVGFIGYVAFGGNR
jgi:hypothetical protein